jgi:hypothetical protein
MIALTAIVVFVALAGALSDVPESMVQRWRAWDLDRADRKRGFRIMQKDSTYVVESYVRYDYGLAEAWNAVASYDTYMAALKECNSRVAAAAPRAPIYKRVGP